MTPDETAPTSDRPFTDDEVLARLRTVNDPCSLARRQPTDIVSFGLVREARGGPRPRVVLHLTDPCCIFRVAFIRQVQAAVGPETEVEFVSPEEIWEPPH